MHFADAALKGLLLGLFMAISVGPTLFAVIKYSLNHSYKAGIAFILGVSLSDVMYVTVANLAAHWLEYLNDHKRIIAYAGATILIIVGAIGVISKHKPQRPSSVKVSVSNAHLLKIFTSGFLINTINPGVIMTWLGAVTVAVNTPVMYRVVLFGSCLLLIVVIDVAKVFLADSIRRKLTLRRIMYLQKFSAACILMIGLALMFSTLFNVQFKKEEEKLESVYQHFRSAKTGYFVKA